MYTLNKLHNIVVYIRSSASRTTTFLKTTKKRISLDNRTRWNSWFQMITQTLSLEKEVDFYTKQFQKELKKNVLSFSDWKFLRTTEQFLEIFFQLTLANEDDQKSISETLSTLFIIKYHIKLYCTMIEQSKHKVNNKSI
jgi:hypothetical protein